MYRLALKPAVGATYVARRVGTALHSRSVSLLGKNPVPSSTTTLKLLGLPASLTESSLRDGLKGIVDARKVEIEPGCAIHVLNEAEATFAIHTLTSAKLDDIIMSECSISHTTLPSLMFENVPSNVSLEALQVSLKAQGMKPLSVQSHGSASLRVSFTSDEEALRAVKMIKNLKLEGKVLCVRVSSAATKGYVVTVHTANLSKESSVKMQDAVKAAFPNAQLENVACNARELQLRYSPHNKGADSLSKSIQDKINALPGVKSVSATGSFPRPAILLRRTALFNEESLQKLLKSQPGAGLVTASRRGRGAAANSMAVYFQTEEQAFAALTFLRQNQTGLKGPDGSSPATNKLSAAYVALSVPTVSITGLPADCTEAQVKALFTILQPLAISIKNGVAQVTLNCPKEVELAILSLNHRPQNINKQTCILTVADSGETAGSDLGVTVTLADDAPEDTHASIMAVLQQDKGTSPLSSAERSNVHVFVAFETPAEAVLAHTNYLKNRSAFDFGSKGTAAISRVSVMPAFAVDVGGLGIETSVETVSTNLTAGGLIAPIQINRSAILKFRRHQEIVPALKALKNKVLPGSSLPLTVVRFRDVPNGGSSEYDVDASEDAKRIAHFNKFSLDAVLTDFMGADPGMRMQIAKSYFERALFDAKARADISYLLSNNVPEATKQEAHRLLNMPSDTRLSRQRLFELFVQREDMQRFTADFDEMRSMLGEADEDDPFDWSQFRLSNSDDMNLLMDELAQTESDEKEARALEDGTHVVMKGDVMVDARKAKKIQRKLAREKRELVDMFGTTDAGEEDDEFDEDHYEREEDPNDPSKIFAATDLSQEDAPNLIDRDGHVWSGCILDTDMVQKTMPGNRVSTHRALVVIGNLRGAAGFGMGKGQAPADALNAAFRDATRNLVHIDLFDNYGLAHDVYGKHNSCHAYIRATPKSRMMVGSPFARAILERFGISSASCKIVGRRDPYAQVRAVFNAISKHENIDEFAKDRGKRYVDLRWIKDQGM